MFESLRIKKNVFWSIVSALLAILIFTFGFSHRSLFNFERKHKLIKAKKEEITALNIEINQLNNNITRLKTDREYVVSYAKTFGYLDKTKNEQIVRIVEDTKIPDDNYQSIKASTKKEHKTPYIDIRAVLILASLVIVMISSYMIINTKKKEIQ